MFRYLRYRLTAMQKSGMYEVYGSSDYSAGELFLHGTVFLVIALWVIAVVSLDLPYLSLPSQKAFYSLASRLLMGQCAPPNLP